MIDLNMHLLIPFKNLIYQETLKLIIMIFLNLVDYFLPLPDSFVIKKDVYQSTQLGSLISIHSENYFPDFTDCKIVLFSVPEYEGSQNSGSGSEYKIREEFFELHNFDFPKISDLGLMKISSTNNNQYVSHQREVIKFPKN